MTLTSVNRMDAPFLSIPLDVLTHIALHTVSMASSIPTLRDLASLHSLLLTCRSTNTLLSISHNPYLYGKVFRLIWDVDPIDRRFGSSAVTSTPLARELQRRFCMLKRVRQRLLVLNQNGEDRGGGDESVVDLVMLFSMMTENDHKNRHQIRDILGRSGVSDLCFALLSGKCGLLSETDASRSHVAVLLALMWMDTEDSIPREVELGRDDEVFDLLEPIVIGKNQICPTTIDLTYFGLQCRLTFVSPVPYARLCTIERYDAIKRRKSSLNTDNGLYNKNTWSCSRRFDQDCARLMTVHPNAASQYPSTTHISPGYHTELSSSFESRWSGGWYVPCPTGPTTVFMVYRAMEFQLREYVCSDSENAVAYADGGGDVEVELARAWFNEDVEITENPSSLVIYDPFTAKSSMYEPRSELHHSNLVDRIYIGETEAEHGAEFEAYTFHGRIRATDGRIALVRKPAEVGTEDLGIWLFHGYIYGENNFVGEWTNTSKAKDEPAGSGWFRFSRDI